ESQEQKQTNEVIVCDFKGKIKELSDHLNNVCPLKISDCWYKPFGCEYNCYKHKLNDHLSSEFKLHFDLVVKFIQTLQEEIKQLKSQIQMNEKNNGNNAILINENISLKKEIDQLQQDIIQSNSKKDNEIKKIEKESQQELLKLR
ncbi:hypothetical protein RFI_39425, partial [Reticulomyxa filosa]